MSFAGRFGAGRASRAGHTDVAAAVSPPGEVDWVAYYDIPQRDRAQPHPVVRWPGPVAAAAHRAEGRLRQRRAGARLAYVDSHFPWRRSGFRYSEASAILEARPDTLFFSAYELTDPFPAPVHPLADFPRIAVASGVTDVYGAFLLFLQGLCGLAPDTGAAPHFMEGPDLWPLFAATGIRVHGSIYPGGGFTLTDHGFEAVAALAKRLTTTFSYVAELLERVPGITEVPPAFTDADFYPYSENRWTDTERLVCLFAGDASPRKGLDATLEAFRQLGPGFHLHVVGPHEHRAGELPDDRATFHGWLQPEQLRELHAKVHVFVSPVRAEAPGPPGSFQGVVDGFPTQAASDSMSSGCLLLSSNPLADHRVLTPGDHYVETGPDGWAVRDGLRALADDAVTASEIARRGSNQVRQMMDVRYGVRRKLEQMGLVAGART